MIISLHVDDFLIAATAPQFKWFIGALEKKFKIKWRKASLCLGIKIEREPTGYSINQQHYLEELIKEFGVADSAPRSTPMTKGDVDALTAGNTGGIPLSTKEHHLYRQIVGKLMYAMVGTRPDLAYALSVLGRFAAAPDTFHLAMAKRVLGYVKSTITLKLHFPNRKSGDTSSVPLLRGYVDSDYANSDDRKSVTGLCFFLSECLIY